MKNYLFSMLLILLLPCGINSQNKMTYAYDASGNRVERTIVLVTSSKKSTLTKAKSTVLSETLSEQVVKIYPNPTKGQLAIEISNLENLKNGSCTIYNIQGKTILKQKIQNLKTNLDISNHSNGMYILHINIDGKISTWKIIKE